MGIFGFLGRLKKLASIKMWNINKHLPGSKIDQIVLIESAINFYNFEQ